MISFDVEGRVVSILCSGFGPANGEVQLAVALDRKRAVSPANIRQVEGIPGHHLWLLDLPPRIRKEGLCQIGVEVRSGERLLEASSSCIWRTSDRHHSTTIRDAVGPSIKRPSASTSWAGRIG